MYYTEIFELILIRFAVILWVNSVVWEVNLQLIEYLLQPLDNCLQRF